METTKKTYTSYQDNEGGNFGLRFNLSREEWIEQCEEWHQSACDEEDNYIDYLNSMTDTDLMCYIQDMYCISIRETSWLKIGNTVQWGTDTENLVEIIEICFDEYYSITNDSDIKVKNTNGDEYIAKFEELYGITNKVCPKCSQPLYVSDLITYPYVCFECDENFYEIEVETTKVTYEWCPDCENESKIRNEFVLQKCEHCGRVILPCSLCETPKCYDCPFDKKKIIEKLNNEPNIEEYNEMYCCDDRENIPQDILIALDYIVENGIE